MQNAILELLAPAVGIAISPMPIIGLILILLSNKPKLNSLVYTSGWLLGNLVVFLIAYFFMGATTSSSDPALFARIINLALGLALLYLAFKRIKERPRKGEAAKVPSWFKKISTLEPKGAFALSFFLSAINPKNMLMGIAAGVSVGTFDLSSSETLLITLIFLLISGIFICLPTLGFFLSGDKLNDSLDRLQRWLIQNNSVIMAGLFILIGLKVILKAFV